MAGRHDLTYDFFVIKISVNIQKPALLRVSLKGKRMSRKPSSQSAYYRQFRDLTLDLLGP